MNERIIDLLQLKGVAAVVLLDSNFLSFRKKLDVLKVVAIEKAPIAEKTNVERIFSGIAEQNANRNLMAHCRFEAAASESVQFRRPVKVKSQIDPLWPKEKFEDQIEQLDELRQSLKGLKPQLIISISDDGTSTLLARFLDESPLSRTWATFYDSSFPARTRPSPRS
jgi:hypothetical protein